MSNDPVLILQMQRMGDIVLSFPLFLWLKRNAPDRPIWVVAEPTFYNELLNVSPAVTYLPWTATHEIVARDYSLIINLSHRPEAAQLAGNLTARLKLGPTRDESGLRIKGRWQLYRASLTGNNRHNRFHWAELNALDCVDKLCFPTTNFDPPRIMPEGNEAVGLFVGASQEEKRPGASFWAALASELERRGMKVVLLGGPCDAPLCEEIKRLHGGRLVDTCGTLGLREFMAVGQTLSLMVTPDTGPMHVGAWSGLLTLNLSMGPVNPWETGPFQPGHYVLRADKSCLGCWQCRFNHSHCRDCFDPVQVAYLTRRLLRTRDLRKIPALPGTRLFRTGRTPEGFYDLIPIGQQIPRASDRLSEVWRGMFGVYFGLWEQEKPRQIWRELSRAHPLLARAFDRAVVELAGRMRSAMVSGLAPGEEFWAASPPALRPLAGYMHMFLENSDFTREAWTECVVMIEQLRDISS